MTCNGHTSMHDGLSPAQFFYNGRTGRQTTVLCRGCAHVIESMGSGWTSEAMGSGWTRDRRSDPQRPDRSRFPGGGSMLRRSPSALPSRRPVAAARLGNTPGYAATD